MNSSIRVNHIETVYTLEDARKIIEAENRERKAKRNKMIRQRLMGVVRLLMVIAIHYLVEDDSASLFVAPMGIGLLFSKRIMIY